jgi:ribosomal protein RSM22 (predicted rRNA methylase)
VDWKSVDWTALERLREVFLGRARAPGSEAVASTPPGPYWTSARDLESYDFTLGRRIAWKWAAVLEPLLARGWSPPARQLVDWGCGSAIGARSLLAYTPEASFDEVVLWDHSPVATTFAEAAIRARRPGQAVRVADPEQAATEGGFVLVVSHVLNELDAAGRAALIALARRAAAVLWVEPGTSEDSRALIAVREELRAEFHCWAPCPHDARCGLLAEVNARHWCHHFARPPTEAFTESGWAEFGRRLGVDLRSLPYAYLVLDRRAPARSPDAVRIIGTPRESAGMMRILRCREDGVAEVELLKRTAPALWRTLEKGRHDGLLAWGEQDGRVTKA